MYDSFKVKGVIYGRGYRFLTHQGYFVEVLEYAGKSSYIIKFDCGYTTTVKSSQIKYGKVRYPFHKTVYGVGFLGEEKRSRTPLEIKCFKVWAGMIERGYSEKWKSRYPTYKEVYVCDEWHNFQNFYKWFMENYKESFMGGWQFDKDILIKGNKIYSPSTCCFVPAEINILFTKRAKLRGDNPIGVEFKKGKYISSIRKLGKLHLLGTFYTKEEAFEAYKKEKEAHIKYMADTYSNKLNEKVYKALYNYKVEITD